ncbi:MAG: NifB/NifX family molybdenum-iron cluster-binding protein [Oscillospiraceae bacterium]
MKIAVTTENGKVFAHFGKTPAFTLAEIDGQTVTGQTLLETGDSGHGALADLLAQNGVQALICGGIGEGARNALASKGIEVFPGVFGDVEQVLVDFAAGRLAFRPDFSCSHHHDHADGHDCGSHHSGC